MELKTWNPKMIAKGFGYDSVQEWANDIKASDLSKPAERAIARLLDGEVTESQEEWDVIDQDGKRIEVRGLLGSQVFFNPSSDNGKNLCNITSNNTSYSYKSFKCNTATPCMCHPTHVGYIFITSATD